MTTPLSYFIIICRVATPAGAKFLGEGEWVTPTPYRPVLDAGCKTDILHAIPEVRRSRGVSLTATRRTRKAVVQLHLLHKDNVYSELGISRGILSFPNALNLTTHVYRTGPYRVFQPDPSKNARLKRSECEPTFDPAVFAQRGFLASTLAVFLLHLFACQLPKKRRTSMTSTGMKGGWRQWICWLPLTQRELVSVIVAGLFTWCGDHGSKLYNLLFVLFYDFTI